MKRVLFFICGLCWMVFGVLAGAFAWQSLFVNSDSQSFILQILTPVSTGSVLFGLVQVVGFCALSSFSFLVGIGLWSGFFETHKR
jgi:hypothetical protein